MGSISVIVQYQNFWAFRGDISSCFPAAMLQRLIAEPRKQMFTTDSRHLDDTVTSAMKCHHHHRHIQCLCTHNDIVGGRQGRILVIWIKHSVYLWLGMHDEIFHFEIFKNLMKISKYFMTPSLKHFMKLFFITKWLKTFKNMIKVYEL